MLQRFGRPDYEHPKAAGYNRALIGAALWYQRDGDPDALST
jgi:hypothetical protein